jgi:HPt (histidine-containing phosphotransfer) domain-containing protein
MDVNELKEKLGLSEEELKELVSLFVETCDSDLDRMRSALREENARGVSEAAHSIKGASGNMRFEILYDLARGIEEDARHNNLSEVDFRINEISSNIRTIAQDFGV